MTVLTAEGVALASHRLPEVVGLHLAPGAEGLVLRTEDALYVYEIDPEAPRMRLPPVRVTDRLGFVNQTVVAGTLGAGVLAGAGFALASTLFVCD